MKLGHVYLYLFYTYGIILGIIKGTAKVDSN